MQVDRSFGTRAIAENAGSTLILDLRSRSDIFLIAIRLRLVVHVVKKVAACRDFSDAAEWKRKGNQDDDAAVIDMDQ